jgi:hypothetical protein
MKSGEKDVNPDSVTEKIGLEPDSSKSGRAIEKLVVEEYVAQFGGIGEKKGILLISKPPVTKGNFLTH